MNAPDDAARRRDEPLDLATWLREIGRLKSDLNGAGEESHARLLRRAFHLSRLAPDPLWAEFASPLSEAEFERDLERSEPDIAAAGLINPSLELKTIKPDGHFSAVVRSPALGASGQYVASAYTIGVIGAWINCICAIAELGAEAGSPVIPDQHRSQSERRPRSTRH